MHFEILNDMKFKSISAKDKISGWNVENIQFNPMLTLLVGASGVGKTKVLNVIKILTRIAKGESFNGFEWKVEFEHDGHFYVWEGEFETKDTIGQIPIKKLENDENQSDIVRERIIDNGNVLVIRSSQTINYKKQDLVKLDNAKSVLELLKNEPSVKPIYDGFRQCYTLEQDNKSFASGLLVTIYKDKKITAEQIKQDVYFSPLDKLCLLRENNLPEFELICKSFINIFPSVESIDFSLIEEFKSIYSLSLRIKEKKVQTWIEHKEISSGMFRTLLQITAIVMANDGDVIMIDEFENGLGVNCINELADLIMEPEADIQVVMTSHHPYIINAIPVKNWKILTRNGCDVHVHTAEQLRIGEHSKHEAFMQLLQTPEYRTGQNR